MSLNQGLINNFIALQNYYKSVNDRGRVIAYNKAIVALRSVSFKITDPSQVKGMRGIGPKILIKIKEYLDTGQIRAVEDKKEELQRDKSKSKKEQVLEAFSNIWGIGPVKAKALYEQGMRSIQDVRENQSLLTKQQKIGLKYYDDLLKKVPRDYITTLYTVIVYHLNKKYGRGTYEIEVCGSYRRGLEESGDIDCLITSEKFSLGDVVELLTKKGLITDTLSVRNEKFMGVARCGQRSGTSPTTNDQHVRLDIEFVSKEQFGAAKLYFTGSKSFNLYMRGIAKKKGYLLNEHGIFYKNGNKVQENPSERDVFEILGMEYVPPERR